MKPVSERPKKPLDGDAKGAQLSSLVDGELTPEEINEQVAALSVDEGGREAWRSYHLIRDLLQQQMAKEYNPNFTQQVMARLEYEPTILAPAKKERTITQGLIGIGLAASVATIALLSSYLINDRAGTEQGQWAADGQIARQQPALPRDVRQRSGVPDLDQFSPYLANHAAVSSASANQGFMPYARVVGYSSER